MINFKHLYYFILRSCSDTQSFSSCSYRCPGFPNTQQYHANCDLLGSYILRHSVLRCLSERCDCHH